MKKVQQKKKKEEAEAKKKADGTKAFIQLMGVSPEVFGLLFMPEKQKMECLADEPGGVGEHVLYDNKFDYPSCGHWALSEMFNDVNNFPRLAPIIIERALIHYSSNYSEKKPSEDVDVKSFTPPGLNHECQDILLRRLIKAMATETRCGLDSKPQYLPTSFTMKNGCCNNSHCPKLLFVESLLHAITEIYKTGAFKKGT